MRHRLIRVILLWSLTILYACAYPDPTPTRRPTVDAGTEHLVWLPFCAARRVMPDKRFGIAEHSLVEMETLGFPNDGRYHARQREQQEEDSPVIFLRREEIAHTHPSDWSDQDELCLWMHRHPGKSYIVGNEMTGPIPTGNGLAAAQYAQWYAEMYNLVRQCDPTARIGPYGPAGYHTRGFLASVWTEFMALTGEPMPVDFFPIHHYPKPGFVLSEEIWKLERWIGWLDGHNGRFWVWTGEKAYWLTEFGLPSWSHLCPEEESLRLMGEMIPWLMENDLGIVLWAWWPSGNKKLFGEVDTRLIKDGVPTALGRRYYELAIGE